MDDKFQDILDSLPKKPPRSRLEPYRELIVELRRRGRTYRDIARILAEKCKIQMAASTIHDFVRVRSRPMPKVPKRHLLAVQTKGSATVATARMTGRNSANRERPPNDDVQQRIADLKRRPAPAQSRLTQFHYDPSEPLRVLPKAGKNRVGKNE
jgi:hypothetical protein